MGEEDSSGEIERSVSRFIADIDPIDRSWLRDAMGAHRTKVNQIFDGEYSDPFDALMYMEESTFRLKRLAMVIFQMRRSLTRLAESGGTTPHSGSDGQ